MTIRSLIACVAFSLCLPVMAAAQDLPFGRWWTMDTFQEQLQLSRDMQDKLDTLYLDSRGRLIDLKSSLERERLNLDRLMHKDPISETEVMAQFKKLEAAHSALNAERFHHVLQVRLLIGEVRFQKLENLFAAMRRKSGPRGHGGPDGPGGPGGPGEFDGPPPPPGGMN